MFTGFIQSQEPPEFEKYVSKEVEIRFDLYQKMINYIDAKVEKSQKELQTEIDSLKAEIEILKSNSTSTSSIQVLNKVYNSITGEDLKPFLVKDLPTELEENTIAWLLVKDASNNTPGETVQGNGNKTAWVMFLNNEWIILEI